MARAAAPAEPLRVCLVGCGWFAQRAHCASLKKLCAGGAVRVAAVCSRTPTNRARALKKLGAAAAGANEHATLADALADVEVDVVVLALPRGAMAQAVMAALRSGKHVVSEKPGAWSVEEAAACWQAYTEGEACWCVSENWAAKAGVLRVGHLLDVGAMPADVSKACYAAILRRRAPDARDWRETDCTEDERCLDVAVHLARALRSWFGEVVSVKALDDDGAAGAGRCFVLLHESGAEGRLSFALRLPAEAAECCTFEFLPLDEDKKSATYDVDAATITLADDTVEAVQGDKWIDGGVRDALRDAFSQILRCFPGARDSGARRAGESRALHLTCAEEALRDTVVAWKMLAAAGGQPAQEWPRFAVGPGLCDAALFRDDAAEKPKFVCRPRSTADVVACVKWCADAGRCAAVASGSCSSWGAAQRSEPYCRVDTTLLRRVLSVKGHVAIVEAGVTLRRLEEALARRGLCLASSPVYVDSTVAGACATGSHGSSARHGTVADAVVGTRVVLADGTVRDLGSLNTEARSEASIQEDEALLVAVRASRGDCGVVVVLALRVVDAYYVTRSCVRLESLELVDPARLRALAEAHEHVWVHWRVAPDAAAFALCLSRCGADDEGADLYDSKSWFPYPCDLETALVAPRPADDAEAYSIQWSLDAAKLQESAGRIAAAVRGAAGDAAVIVELKFVQASRRTTGAPNSDAHALACCWNVWLPDPTEAQRTWARAVDGALRDVGARLHQGKAQS
ncbi:hypothetical protein M885DRAFT_532420 [Pelagophyceae sp. CCMP2097]|nr:hypothetical protein M885DRAFT_532420 [Pelagophyceae sp. CCMP2097]